MKFSEKILPMIILFAFALMAGSVVCLASAQPAAMAMENCGNGMGAAATMCPFMSASVPAVLGASSITKTLGLTVALMMVAVSALGIALEKNRANRFFTLAYERKRDLTTGRRADITLNLISDGIVHSKVFGY